MKFLNKFGKKILIFGFTNDVYSTFFDKLNLNKKINLKNGILIHGGGWKKLEDKKNFKFNF